MQQSFESQVLQSNLTDCSKRKNNNNTLIEIPYNGPNNTLSIGARLIPLLLFIPSIIGTIILFIWSFIITAAWLHLLLVITPSYITNALYSMNKNAYNLSIQHSLHDLWRSKSYGIATIILLVSFIFPIIKLFYILFLAFSSILPPSLSLPSRRHERILFILELLNKYSFINIFILVILMSCVYINIKGEIESMHIASQILVEPSTGIVIFGCAMIISSILTVLIKYKYIPFYRLPHLSSQFGVESGFDLIMKPSSSILQRSGYNDEQSPLLFSKNYSFRSFCVKMISFVFFVFVVIGAVALFIAQIPFIEIKYEGELSKYMTDPGSQRIYSLDGIVQSVDDENNNGNTKFLRTIYELFGIVLPLITILLLILLWMIPMPKWIHIRLKAVIWCTHMLNAIDVIIISSIIIWKELPQTFEYIVKHQYAPFCHSLFIQFGDNTMCESMSINIYLHSGVWIAVAFYVSLWIVVVYSVYFSQDDYSAKQLRKLKVKIKKQQREDQGGAMFDTIDENKTL